MLDIAAELSRVYGHLPALATVSALLQRRPLRSQRHHGAGLALGLIEPAIHPDVADLQGADLTVCTFASNSYPAEALMAHGTHSATLLVGQGHRSVLGLLPRAQLSLALVAQADGTASPEGLADAIDWLLARNVALMAIPLGDHSAHKGVAQALERARERRVPVFAAAGNAHPQRLLFPARHSAALAIGALDPSGRLRVECCRLPALDGMAPGTDIPALVDGRHIEPRSGSSVACVVAAGLAALSLSVQQRRLPPSALAAFNTVPDRCRASSTA